MSSSEYLRRQAVICWRWVAAASDRELAGRLARRAVQFEAEADRAEEQLRLGESVDRYVRSGRNAHPLKGEPAPRLASFLAASETPKNYTASYIFDASAGLSLGGNRH